MRKNYRKLGFVIKTSDSSRDGLLRRKAPAATPGRPVRLLSVSHYHQRPGVHPTPIHFDRRKQFIEVLTGGRGWVEMEGRWQEVVAGDILWHAAGDYTVGRSDFANPYSCLAVGFIVTPGMRRPVPHLTRWEALDEVLQFTNQVTGLHADDAFDSRVLLRYVLSRVQFQAELYLHRQLERALPSELQRVLEVINNRFAEPLHLGDMAEAAGWSVAHLHDRFKERLGISPHQALIRRRIQAARELLGSTHHPVKGVAALCGFPNAAAFCVQFRKTTRLSPKEYRERQTFGRRRG
jgi:AraC-like DNA-binding protein